ncbi:MAG: ABC transporter ATP-binding protein [Longimicrobiales bacterium]|nr:ABC transporter ATP-binding protein [Longimicrobiales bacterium]
MIRLEPRTSEGGSSRVLPPVTLRLEGIRKSYGAVHALDGVDLEFRPGRVTAVLGPNGAGKTTLIKVILGLVRADAGRVEMDGRELTDDPGYRARIGTMPQLPDFPENLTGRELLEMIDDLRDFRDRPDETLLHGFGLAPEMEKPVRELSGGTRQKLNAALAFRYGAPLLILDEPTASLDPVAARILKEKVREVRDAGATVILTSHDLGQVQAVADDVAFLLEGRLHFEGTLAALLKRTGEDDLEGAVAALLADEGVHGCTASARLPREAAS